MGEVYKAKDTRLDRIVAIKVLPEQLSQNPELKQRFEQEARAVSSLNHPHICTLHDIGQEQGIDFMVMEYLEGETLAARLERGALPLEQALEFSAQIADALDEAHRRGIVHRDLKPANVFLTKTGVKLLDFGLAKLLERKEVAETSSVLTLQKPLTEHGAILGTFQYMAPEQLEAKSVDARTDLFAFGAVLYEMITGRKAFQGESQASLIGAILHTNPPPLSELRPMAPAALGRLVRKCLAKDPDARWQTARDLKDELRWLEESGDGATGIASESRDSKGFRPLAALGFTIGGALLASLFLLMKPEPPVNAVLRSTIELPEGETLSFGAAPNLALSPDGTTLAFRISGRGRAGLFIRSMNELESRLVLGADVGFRLLFSPDGQWVAFARGGRLRKASIKDGTEVTIAEGISGIPFDWVPDGRIVATASDRDGLVLIPSEGQPPQRLTTVNREAGELSHVFPQFLPGGEILFTIKVGENHFEHTRIAVLSPESGDIQVIREGGTYARYAPTGRTEQTGHLLFARPGVVFAAPFNVGTLAIEGAAVPVLSNVRTMGGGMVELDYSDDGTLVYAPSTTNFYERQLLSVDLDGRGTVLIPEPRGYNAPAFSPDGGRLALTIETESKAHVAIYEMDRGTLTPVTFEGRNLQPVWSPDGSRLVFASDRGGGAFNLYLLQADGSGNVERLTTSENTQIPFSWSPDGRFVAFVERDPNTRHDVWVVSLEEERTAEPLIQTPFSEDRPGFSPDGRWMAYTTDQTGRDEIWVQPFPEGVAHRVSIEGGSMPVWAPSGSRIYFLAPNRRIMSVSIRTAPGFEADRPAPLPGSARVTHGWSHHAGAELRNLDLSPDGSRFVLWTGNEPPNRLHLVTNWFAELRELAPAN